MNSELVSRLWTTAVRLSADARRAELEQRPDWPALASEALAAADLAADAMADPYRASEGLYRHPQPILFEEC